MECKNSQAYLPDNRCSRDENKSGEIISIHSRERIARSRLIDEIFRAGEQRRGGAYVIGVREIIPIRVAERAVLLLCGE